MSKIELKAKKQNETKVSEKKNESRENKILHSTEALSSLGKVKAGMVITLQGEENLEKSTPDQVVPRKIKFGLQRSRVTTDAMLKMDTKKPGLACKRWLNLKKTDRLRGQNRLCLADKE